MLCVNHLFYQLGLFWAFGVEDTNKEDDELQVYLKWTLHSIDLIIVHSYTVYGHFCCSVRCTFAGRFNKLRTAFKSLRTLICNTFDRGSYKFPAEHLSLLLEWFTPFLTLLFLLYSILVSSFYLSVNIFVLYPDSWSRACNEIWSVRSLGRILKEFKIVDVPEKIACFRHFTIWTPGTGYREERNRFLKADIK